MQRAILLQTDATTSKKRILQEFSMKAVELANFLLSQRTSKKLMDLHSKWYSTIKANTPFNSQVICDIERTVVRKKGNSVKAVTVKFNMPRNCKTFETKSYLFVEFGMYPRQRTAVPIRKNNNYQRYTTLIETGWECKTYGLTSDGQVVAFLTCEKEVPSHKNVVGVDVNSKCFAVSVLTPQGKVLRQLYFGKDIWVKRKKIFRRRERLQSLADKGSHHARQKLRLLAKKERNFVRNRLGEVVRDITNVAVEYDADIGIEDLKRFKSKSRKFNKEVLRIPTLLFKNTMEGRCFDKDLRLNLDDPYHTSKWCTRCGAVMQCGHSSSNYTLFKCSCCGQVVNSDRKSSLAVAVKTMLVRDLHNSNQACFSQTTYIRVPVNGLLRSDDGFGFRAVHDVPTPMESPSL